MAQFWSFTVYDNESRCFVDTGTYPDRSSRDDIVKNADGYLDLHFGPTPPKGKLQSNWIKTPCRKRAGLLTSGFTVRRRLTSTKLGFCLTFSRRKAKSYCTA